MKNKKLRNLAAAALVFTGAEACDFPSQTQENGEPVDTAASKVLEVKKDISDDIKNAMLSRANLEYKQKLNFDRAARIEQYQQYCNESLKYGYNVLNQRLGKKNSIKIKGEHHGSGSIEVKRESNPHILRLTVIYKESSLFGPISFSLRPDGGIDGRFPESQVLLDDDPKPYSASPEMIAKMVLDIFKVK